jgi:hypothetical protein
MKNVIPPKAGFDMELHLTIVFALSLIPKVLENFNRIVFMTIPNKATQTKNSAYTKEM